MSDQENKISAQSEVADPAECSLLDPRDGESDRAYEAFIHYFEMPSPRSMKKVAEKTGASENSLEDWSVKYEWQKRLKAYRAYLAHQRIRADVSLVDLQQQFAETCHDWVAQD